MVQVSLLVLLIVATISGVGEDVSPREFGDNTWGYALTNTNANSDTLTYNSLPAYDAANTPQYTSAKNLADSEYNLKLVFAAKINANSPSDHYTTKAVVSVVADAKGRTLLDIDELQDMTAGICEDTPAPSAEDIKTMTAEQVLAATPSKQLKDKRDGKYYWVSKLADGNCWMTQNLDFDVPEKLNIDRTITSDITTTDFTTDTIAVDNPSDWPANNNDPKYNGYYDPGDYIYNGLSDNPHGRGHSCDTTVGLSECATKYPEEWSATTDNTNTLGNEDAHYHVGNYYSFSAATVKSGDDLSIIGNQASDSICPRGWQLPVSGRDNNNDSLAPWNHDKSFTKLFESYGYTWNQGYWTNTANGGTSYNIYASPFYFTCGGWLNASVLGSAGNDIRSWSSTIISSSTAFYLSFNSYVVPAGNDSSNRYDGYSVRCVAR